MAGYEKSDYWSKKAASEGYPARSVYKLSEIDKKFHLKLGRTLDLGAAPGSWTTYLLKKGAVVACDLKPLSKDLMEQAKILGPEDDPKKDLLSENNLIFLEGDMGELHGKLAAFGPYDSVLCDAAPSTTGNKLVDRARSESLVELALSFADTLVEGGSIVIKFFQTGRQEDYLRQMREIFKTAKGFKPVACRAQSVEMYLIGSFYKGGAAARN